MKTGCIIFIILFILYLLIFFGFLSLFIYYCCNAPSNCSKQCKNNEICMDNKCVITNNCSPICEKNNICLDGKCIEKQYTQVTWIFIIIFFIIFAILFFIFGYLRFIVYITGGCNTRSSWQ